VTLPLWLLVKLLVFSAKDEGQCIKRMLARVTGVRKAAVFQGVFSKREVCLCV
jgi:hypothetical protein